MEIMIVGTFGIAYCGSTLLDLLLGTQPEITAWGEIRHFAISSWFECCICGSGCQIFTPEFKTEIRSHPQNLYCFLGDRQESGILLISDKDVIFYQRGGGLSWGSDKAIVLFKHPLDAGRSAQRRDGVNPHYALKSWQAGYEKVIDYLRAEDLSTIYVYLDFLLVNPEKEVERICSFLETPFDPERLKYCWDRTNLHRIGGNSDVVALLDEGPDPFWLDKIKKPKEKGAISDSEVWELFNQMKKQAEK